MNCTPGPNEEQGRQPGSTRSVPQGHPGGEAGPTMGEDMQALRLQPQKQPQHKGHRAHAVHLPPAEAEPPRQIESHVT